MPWRRAGKGWATRTWSFSQLGTLYHGPGYPRQASTAAAQFCAHGPGLRVLAPGKARLPTGAIHVRCPCMPDSPLDPLG
eukprot:15666-Alexandrium_andersonii.AAC.1